MYMNVQTRNMDHVTAIKVKMGAEAAVKVDWLNSDHLNSAPSSSCSAHTSATSALFPLCSQHTGAILRLDEMVRCPVIFTSDESVFIKLHGPRVDVWFQTNKQELQNEVLKQKHLCENKGIWMLQLVLKLA